MNKLLVLHLLTEIVSVFIDAFISSHLFISQVQQETVICAFGPLIDLEFLICGFHSPANPKVGASLFAS